ncbi:MAG: C69 family dipeptidase [Cyclobacteriaceae bacterium]|nr:C69 family dipeptidase [Cyclobacteriaceae bacterium]
MCDILYIPPSGSYSGNLLFAKNSDREPDEAQAIEYIPSQFHSETTVTCTYITIPQVRETFACLISRPFHMWGAEMGVNEHGVVIGNEAVFTRVKFKKDNSGLTGMDMLRLALERSTSAQQALQCIVSLLEEYGQDACGGYRNKNFFYHNSFLIADSKEAFVLETAGKQWAAENVNSVRSLSNCLSIHQPHCLSTDAINLAVRNKWYKPGQNFSFARAYSDWIFTRLGRGARRAATTCSLAKQTQQPIQLTDCFKILQSHNLPDHVFKPSRADTASVCMHATGLFNPSETTGSMVAEIRTNKPHTVWLTGTSHPCLSVYIPFFLTDKPLKYFKSPSAKPDDSLWWLAHRLHAWIMKKYNSRKLLIEEERQALQNEFIEREARLIVDNRTEKELADLSSMCLGKVFDAYSRWCRLAGI